MTPLMTEPTPRRYQLIDSDTGAALSSIKHTRFAAYLDAKQKGTYKCVASTN